MTSATHTPGPWLDPVTLEWMYEPHKLLQRREDALLMGFAPEMLAALKDLITLARHHASNKTEEERVERAVAIMAKAEGRAS